MTGSSQSILINNATLHHKYLPNLTKIEVTLINSFRMAANFRIIYHAVLEISIKIKIFVLLMKHNVILTLNVSSKKIVHAEINFVLNNLVIILKTGAKPQLRMTINQ